jgi:hypothetical protein
MAMGKRKRHAKQASMWVATQDLPRSAGHPFYARLNQIPHDKTLDQRSLAGGGVFDVPGADAKCDRTAFGQLQPTGSCHSA